MKTETASDRYLGLLVSTGFLVSLGLLLLNDFLLKQSFHNALTGKLSDFAGLFVFPLFWTAFFPHKRSFVYLVTAVAFVVWKSAYSQPLIDSWNGLVFFSIARTVDHTDLAALLVLPFSYSYRPRLLVKARSPALLYFIGVISVFAFAATSFSHTTKHGNDYYFPISKYELLQRMSRLPKDKVSSHFWQADDFEVSYSCTRAAFSVAGKGNQSVITLKETDFRCPTPPDQAIMREVFEKEFIEKLKTLGTDSSQIKYILATPMESPKPTPAPQKPER